MGCDIHMMAEVQQDDGSWKSAGEINGDRNYDLFAILANVRNGYGFAGVPTGEGFVPISDPRGVPEDATADYTRWVDDWSGDGHSHSWLTVAEIMAYDWTQTTRKQGFVDPIEFARWKLTGQPRSWSGDVMGSMIRKISNEEMLAHIEGLLAAPLGWHNLHDLAEMTEQTVIRRVSSVSWEIPYTDAGSELLSTILPRLWRLGPPDRVRLVFFFDN